MNRYAEKISFDRTPRHVDTGKVSELISASLGNSQNLYCYFLTGQQKKKRFACPLSWGTSEGAVHSILCNNTSS